jgi:preprotein translocase subunit YajC
MLSTTLLPLCLLLEEPAAEGSGGPSFLLPMLAIGAIFWFVMIAPERKRKKARESMIAALKKGDKVMTTSGMYGSVAQVQGEIVTLQISDNVRVKFSLAAIQGKVEEDAKANGKPKAEGQGSKTPKELQPQKAAEKAGARAQESADQDEVVESK